MEENNTPGGRVQAVLSRRINRVDVQVSILTGVVAVLSCFLVFWFSYRLTYDNMIDNLVGRVASIHSYVETFLEEEIFQEINTQGDMDSDLYRSAHDALVRTKVATGVAYLYTAKQTEDGRFIYVVDGLDPAAGDFRYPGDLIEEEIVPELERALAGEEVWPEDIKDTDWGKIFIAYLPVHRAGRVVGVVGAEFRADAQYDTYMKLRILMPVITLGACLVASLAAALLFRRISNPNYRDMANTDQLTQLKSRNAFEVDVRNLDARQLRRGVGMCLIDLNNLKLVNDTLGHQFGDVYLQCAAEVLRRQAPERSALYRVGGDEFVVLTWGMELAELDAWMQETCCAFLRDRPSWDLELSFSAGCALFDETQDQDLESVYRRADQRMYARKKEYHSSRDDE